MTALVLVLGLSGLAAVILPAPAGAATGPDVSTALDPANGFPLWYQDSDGTRITACLDVADPNCIVLADAGYDPSKPLSFPTNYPSETFYTTADSDRLTTPGCSGTQAGRFSVITALEAAFANGTPVPGDQMVFGRVRVSLNGGLCPSSSYTLTYPYGQLTFSTNASGALAKNQGTTDIGCVPVAPTVCDWRVALSGPVAKSFLRWDPAVAPAAPEGYLGDAVTAHRIVGAPYTAPGETAPANYVRVTGPGLASPLQTNLFVVSGKLAGPLTADRKAVDFGGEPVGQTTPTRRITVTNLAPGAITPQAAALTGTDAADFQVVSDGCAGMSLAQDQTCTLDVAFAPQALGARSASLDIAHSGSSSPLRLALAGTGTQPTDTVLAAVTPASVDFGDQRLGVRSSLHEVTVASKGTAPLTVSTVDLSGGDADEFSIVRDTCTDAPVAPGGTCTVAVAFDPTRVGAAATSLRLASNDPASPASAPITGTGYGGVAAVSAGVNDANGFPDWYQDEQGVRLVQCLDPDDPNCVVLPGGTFAGKPPLHFPDNFPDEFFYSVTDSDVLTTPGCGSSPPGKAMIRMAIEGAFGQGQPLAGDQMTFGRIRIFATSGLCAGQTYTFVHPYGVSQFTADADGAIRRADGTQDIGCLGAGPTTPCDFGQAVASPVLGGFLRWDPSVAPAAPAGYLGDAATLHRVVGAPYTVPGNGPANYFRIFQGDNLVAGTNMFTVMGKLGGPLVADPVVADFGQVAGDSSGTTTVTLTNQGADALVVNGFSVAGAQAGDFVVDPATDSCTGKSLAADGSCTVDVTFTPGGVGARSARLVVDHSGLNSPMPVGLQGNGGAPDGQAGLSVDQTSLSFTDLAVGRTSVPQTVTVSNLGGSAPLVVDDLSLSGVGAADYAVVGNSCAPEVAVGGSCTVDVAFAPTTGGLSTAVLRVGAATASPASVDVALSARGFAGTSAVSSTLRDPDGFPAWYQDGNGVRLAPCLDAADPGCVVLGGPGFDPARPMAFPGNFPPEFFYALADSERLDMPGCGGTSPGTAMLRLALEGTFANGTAEPGQQATFGRVRITVTSGLCPNQTYTFTTPYGDVTATTDAAGAINRADGTTDVGCGGPPCSFADARGSKVLDSFVRWAPGVGAPAPAGHLGDGVTFHRIVGGTNTAGGKPVNYFEITGTDGTSVARTDRFLVSGKLASGLQGTSTNFGDRQVGTTSAPGVVSFTNVGSDPVDVVGAAMAGADPGAFTITGGTCQGATLAPDASCAVSVVFAPAAARVYGAEVRLSGAGGRVLASAAVSGVGVEPATPRASLSVTSLAFPTQRVGTTSDPVDVTVTNTGTGPLLVGGLVVNGADAGDFSVGGAACGAIAAGDTCVIPAQFSPTATGTRAATLQVPSNDPLGAATVSLSGTGGASEITLSKNVVRFGTLRSGRTRTTSVSLTNTGTMTLRIQGVRVDDTRWFSVDRGTCTGAVNPSRSCSISVTFRPSGAGVQRISTVRFDTNAMNPPTLQVQGTVR